MQNPNMRGSLDSATLLKGIYNNTAARVGVGSGGYSTLAHNNLTRSVDYDVH
jgi:hypothetical protein